MSDKTVVFLSSADKSFFLCSRNIFLYMGSAQTFLMFLQDNFLKAQDAEPKPKKPRKKTKPSALTRPPKKGKKKKNQRKNVRPQNQVPVQDTAADTGKIDR